MDGVSELPGPAEVFTFEVETDHTYCATDLDVLVHNTCGEYMEEYADGDGTHRRRDVPQCHGSAEIRGKRGTGQRRGAPALGKWPNATDSPM
ncbi:hypothetical protein JHN63_09875 [Streptomyces sp. MBT65]|uniref:hypothetical protein n=1 Tax=Streptomyces sp. MBT65 TaxID=1488395 RepID=UPI00190A2BA2|nr:hypothetical protein [Streptomyces sp. MBT65]MBK3574124.1 hypothetical protein [Streptomyces sp. MBT65]